MNRPLSPSVYPDLCEKTNLVQYIKWTKCHKDAWLSKLQSECIERNEDIDATAEIQCPHYEHIPCKNEAHQSCQKAQMNVVIFETKDGQKAFNKAHSNWVSALASAIDSFDV